jgi:hypothetical protein
MTATDDANLKMVIAKLDRPPQDGLHAAVVLEAWVGKRPEQSLAESDGMRHTRMPPVGPSLRPVPLDNTIDLREFTVLVTILASVFLWLPALRELLNDQVSTTMAWALPLALGMDRAIRVRYLGTGQIQTMMPAVWYINGVALVGLATFWMISDAAQVGLALTVMWGHAGILAMRKWPLVYINIVIAVATWLYLGESTLVGLTAGALAMLVATSLAVVTTESDRRIPETLWWTIAAGITGASAGILLTAEPEMWRNRGWWLGAAVLVVSLSGWWASARITQLWVELPSQFAEVDLDDDRKGWGGLVLSGAVAGALSRVVLPTYVLLLICVAVGETSAAILVGAFAVFAIAMLLLGLVVAAKRWGAAVVISVLAAATAIVFPDGTAGLPMLVGSGVAAVGFAVTAAITFRDSATAFATRMVIR